MTETEIIQAPYGWFEGDKLFFALKVTKNKKWKKVYENKELKEFIETPREGLPYKISEFETYDKFLEGKSQLEKMELTYELELLRKELWRQICEIRLTAN